MTNKKAVSQLKSLQESGHVFHGSPKKEITELTPHTAQDTDKHNTFNNDTAIFATTRPEASIIFACVDRNKLPEKIRSGTYSVESKTGSKITATIPRKWKNHVQASKGYVYCLPHDTFKHKQTGGWQVKSKQSVTPVAKIKVDFALFEKLGGILEWS